MVVDAVEDLDAAAVGELPVGAVGLPEFVGQIGLEPNEGRARALVGLRSDQAVPSEDAPDGRHRGRRAEFKTQVEGDRVRAAVMAGGSEFSAQANDRGLDLGRDGVGTGAWPP